MGKNDLPFPEYPRPLLERGEWTNLNGPWEFAESASPEIPRAFPETIVVPYPPQSRLSGIGRTIPQKSYVFYRKSFETHRPDKGTRLFLRFGAVDREAKVYLNGKEAGAHDGGYLPFSLDLTDLVRDGENILTVRVYDDTSYIYPYGKQRIRRGGMWYTPVSGIWQSVYLEEVPEKPIERIDAQTTARGIELTVYGGEKQKTLTLEETGERFDFSGDTLILPAERFEYWSPEHPKLYFFTLDCGKDRVRSYFARRTVEVCGREILLNGEKFFFHGLLDQGYYEDGIFLPENEDRWEQDLTLLKDLGFQMLRKHIKLEPQRFYFLCDKLGVIVFQDMINNGKYSFFRDTLLPTLGVRRMKRRPRSAACAEEFINTAKGVQDELFSHPSVVYYTIFNEGWGEFSPDDVYEQLKARDPSRVYDTASGWFGGAKSDVCSVHTYFKRFRMPKNKEGRPVALSEFGGYSLPLPGRRFNEKKNYGYRLFHSKEELQDAIVRLYEDEILPAVKEGLSAAVLTQFSDVEDETNGVITYDRAVVKLDEGVMRALAKELENAAKDPGTGS